MLTKIRLGKANEAERVDHLLTKQSGVIERQFLLFVRRTTSPVMLKRVEELVVHQNIEGVLKGVDTYIEQLSNVLAHVFINTAGEEADVWARRFHELNKATSTNIDLTDPSVAEPLTRNRQNFIQNLSRQQRDIIRDELIKGIRAGESSEKIARRFSNIVGLTNEQRRAVASYQQLLEQGNRSALDRELRNPKFDSTITTAIDENDVLTGRQIETMLGAYSNNLRLARAENIAATEGLRMVNQARNIAIRQVAAATGINASKGTKTWDTTMDGRERATHGAMSGQTVAMDSAFRSPSGAQLLYPGDTSLGAGANEVINCRCGVSYEFEE